MKRTSGNITIHEIIGLKAVLVGCSQANLEGVSGTIVDETKNMVKLQVSDKIKMIPKALAHLSIVLPDQKVVTIVGKAILGRPEDRIARGRGI